MLPRSQPQTNGWAISRTTYTAGTVLIPNRWASMATFAAIRGSAASLVRTSLRFVEQALINAYVRYTAKPEPHSAANQAGASIFHEVDAVAIVRAEEILAVSCGAA